MFRVPTTIVLGAGASCGYGYPLGHDLIDEMIDTCQAWIKHNQTVFVDHAKGASDLKNRLKFYDPISIDSFLTHYRSNTELVSCAKRAITQILLNKGKTVDFSRSKLKVGQEPFHWYRFLWDAIVKGHTADDLANQNVPLNFNIITFNYDASLESFLYSRVMASGSMFSLDQRQDFLDKLKRCIHHVYGCVMNYKWCDPNGSNTGDEDSHFHAIDDDIADQIVRHHYGRIHLVDERQGDRTKMQDVIKKSHQVLFLGFAFDETNIGPQVLDLEHSLMPRVRGTATEVPPVVKYTNLGDSRIINSRLEALVKPNVPHNIKIDEVLIKSIKKVYRAVSEDFTLNSLN